MNIRYAAVSMNCAKMLKAVILTFRDLVISFMIQVPYFKVTIRCFSASSPSPGLDSQSQFHARMKIEGSKLLSRNPNLD